MGPETGARPTALALALLPLASAWSIPSLRNEQRLHARADANKTTIPAAINIGPSQYWDGDDGPWSSFPLQVGNHAQNVRALVSTQANTVITVGADGCPSFYPSNCNDLRGQLFLPNESITWVANSVYNLGIEQNLGMDPDSDVGFDTVTLGWQGSGGPSVQRATVFNLASPDYWIGAFGLRPDPANFTNQNDPQLSFMQQLVNNNTIPSLTYGYTAGNQYRLSKVFGSLVLGGYDENRFDTTKNVSLGMGADINRDLLIWVQSITTDAGSPSNLLPDGGISILIDSTIGPLWLPESACTAFEQAFGLTYDNTSEFYLVNSSLHDTLQAQNANVTFTLGAAQTGGSTVDVVLPYGAFDLSVDFPNVQNPNTSMYFPLKRAANDTQYTLGRTFLQEAYIIVDYDNHNFTVAPCTWDSNKVASSSLQSILRANETSSENSGGSSSNTGAIAGGVVGGVVGAVIIIGAIIWFMRRKKQTEKKRLAELEATNAAAAGKSSQDSANEGKPFISQPMGGELGGGEIHELNSTHKPFAQEMESPFKMDPNKHGYSEMDGGEFYGPNAKNQAAEMHGDTPVFEMPGSDVHEMPTPEVRPQDQKP
ncbi:hypothetical protein PRZ48_000533 [Zasmidium cellare]|uniref:Peptidase A1 domain-containing protein n=1 Tax=Zasmidium cellare TaxID=395010 RepID=A0ABR0F024_ZASCE|nr:hypothetical protein PRZ48_000533 [Zasmidium cellare]